MLILLKCLLNFYNFDLILSFIFLGFLVALELKIIPVKPYVHMKYIPGTKDYKYTLT
jgi:hypothetical protein